MQTYVSAILCSVFILGNFSASLYAQRVFQLTDFASNQSAPDGKVCSNATFPDRNTGNWHVEKVTLRGGSQEGVELLQVDNGKLKFSVIPTRGMSIYRAECDGVQLSWNSPVKQIVHPALIELNDHGGLGWLDGFNETMCRCGVEFAGHPGEDNGQQLTLHGRIGNTPASSYEVAIDDQAPFRIRIRGLVEERRFKFGLFELWTEVSTVPGSQEFTVSDRLVNRSEYEKEYQLIYHSNFGRNILEQGAEFVAPVKSAAPFDEYAAEDLATFTTYRGPTAGYGEQVYCLEMHADGDRHTEVMLRNSAASQGVSMRYDTSSLPYFTLWKNTDTETDGYVTGLEPGTGFPYNRSIERVAGRVPKLAPGAEVRFEITYAALTNQEEVRAAAARITDLAGGREPEIHRDPPKK